MTFYILKFTDIIWKSARDSLQLSPHFSSTEKQFKMLLHGRKSLYRALAVDVNHHALRRYEKRSFPLFYTDLVPLFLVLMAPR